LGGSFLGISGQTWSNVSNYTTDLGAGTTELGLGAEFLKSFDSSLTMSFTSASTLSDVSILANRGKALGGLLPPSLNVSIEIPSLDVSLATSGTSGAGATTSLTLEGRDLFSSLSSGLNKVGGVLSIVSVGAEAISNLTTPNGNTIANWGHTAMDGIMGAVGYYGGPYGAAAALAWTGADAFVQKQGGWSTVTSQALEIKAQMSAQQFQMNQQNWHQIYMPPTKL
jgi:hypothetical protein